MTTDSGSPPPWPPAPPAAELDPAPPKKRPAWFAWAVGAAVVVVAVGAFFVAKSVAGGGGSSPAAASTNSASGSQQNGQNGSGFAGRIPGSAGTITAINGTTLTIQDRQNQSVKVTTTSSTRVSVQTTVPLSSIANGDRISATGTQSGTTVAATRITVMNLQGAGQFGQRANGGTGNGGPPAEGAGGFPRRNGGTNGTGSGNAPASGFAFGTVTNVSGGTITISSFNGSTMTITTTSSTKVTKSEPGSLSDLKVGQTIRATGTTASDGTVAATAINEGAGGGFGGFRGQGTP